MVVMAPREKWTDERLDDLNAKVDRGFAETKAEIRELRGEMNARFDKADARFEKNDAKLESLHKILIASAGGIMVALIGLIGTLIGINAF